jgi:hypothetical protein
MGGRINTKDAVKQRNQAGGVMYDGQPAGDDLFADMPPEEKQALIVSALKKTDTGIDILGCDANAAGLLIPDNIDPESLTLLSDMLFAFEDRMQIYIGDMLWQAGRLKYGSLKTIAKHYRRDESTLSKWKSICGAVTIFLRRKLLAEFPNAEKPLTISHYEKVMALPEDKQEHFLRLTLQKGWAVARLHRAIHAKEKGDPTTPYQRMVKSLTSHVERWAVKDFDQRTLIADKLQEWSEQVRRGKK